MNSLALLSTEVKRGMFPEINLSTSRSTIEPRTASWVKCTLSDDDQKFSGMAIVKTEKVSEQIEVLFYLLILLPV